MADRSAIGIERGVRRLRLWAERRRLARAEADSGLAYKRIRELIDERDRARAMAEERGREWAKAITDARYEATINRLRSDKGSAEWRLEQTELALNEWRARSNRHRSRASYLLRKLREVGHG